MWTYVGVGRSLEEARSGVASRRRWFIELRPVSDGFGWTWFADLCLGAAVPWNELSVRQEALLAADFEDADAEKAFQDLEKRIGGAELRHRLLLLGRVFFSSDSIAAGRGREADRVVAAIAAGSQR
jgi:hypothetical protein